MTDKNATSATASAAVDPFDDPVTSNKMAVRALIPLLITFVLGTLCLQGFNLVFQQVGADVGAPGQACALFMVRWAISCRCASWSRLVW